MKATLVVAVVVAAVFVSGEGDVDFFFLQERRTGDTRPSRRAANRPCRRPQPPPISNQDPSFPIRGIFGLEKGLLEQSRRRTKRTPRDQQPTPRHPKKNKKTAPSLVSACTEAVLKDKCTNATVSSRTLSFPTSLGPQVSYVKAGASIALSEVAGTPDAPIWAPYPGKQIKAKYNFVCASAARKQLKAYYGAKSARSKDNWLWCVDGLNEAGEFF
jgi:hypothetical protein